MKLFRKRPYIPLRVNEPSNGESKPVVPDGLWEKCPQCKKTIYSKELGRQKVCPHCGYNFRIDAWTRITLLVDDSSFEEWDEEVEGSNPLGFPGYDEKLDTVRKQTGLREAVVTGTARIKGVETVLCVMDSAFLMGSMGQAVGEKLTRAFERATEWNLPIVVCTASGGARMQEGIISLMQMAKVGIAVSNHSKSGLLYITVLTDPTTGGVTASFAMEGDIILAEPGATIGFAGKRVIEQTIKASVPEGFQTAEHLMSKGFIDQIIPRSELRNELGKLLSLHAPMKQREVQHER